MKINESGRSMIEMLGVLAIIGVLSIGGIAGYAKAMSKYKTNKTIEQVTQTVASTRNLFAGHKDYSSLGTGSSGAKSCSTTDINANLIVTGHLVPDEMVVLDPDDASKSKLESLYASDVILSCGDKRNSGDKKAFVIIYKNVPEDSCIELATQDWGGGASSGMVALCINTDISETLIGGNSVSGCSLGKPMTVLEASSACTNRSKQSGPGLNTVYWKFY